MFENYEFETSLVHVITPNADTFYSMAFLDLRAEQIVLQVTAVTDRYDIWQFVDLFGTNLNFIGSRATDSDSGTYLTVGLGWQLLFGLGSAILFQSY